jgi:hypothetical protein
MMTPDDAHDTKKGIKGINIYIYLMASSWRYYLYVGLV